MNNTYILMNDYGKINGTLLDCFDLYIWCKHLNIDITLALVNGTSSTLDILHALYNERKYNFYCDDISLFDNIQCIKQTDIVFLNKVILFDYTTLFENLHFLRKSKVVYISNLVMGEKYKFEIDYMDKYPNIDIWGESKYGFMCNKPYIQKILTPNISQYNQNTLIVCPGLYKDEIIKNIKNNRWKLNTIPDNFIVKNSNIYESIWGRFNKIIYLQSPKVYDRKPRIIYEAKKCNLEVLYYELLHYNKIDGSYIRFYDNIDRSYTKDDDLIYWITNE